MKPSNLNSSQAAIGCCLIISFLGVLIYANHLNNPFQFDSVPYITNNAKLKNPEILLTPGFLQKEFIHRGLLRISIALNVHLNGFKPFGFHLLSLALHILNALLLFFIFEKSFQRFSLSVQGWNNKKIRSVSFFAAVLFRYAKTTPGAASITPPAPVPVAPSPVNRTRSPSSSSPQGLAPCTVTLTACAFA